MCLFGLFEYWVRWYSLWLIGAFLVQFLNGWLHVTIQKPDRSVWYSDHDFNPKHSAIRFTSTEFESPLQLYCSKWVYFSKCVFFLTYPQTSQHLASANRSTPEQGRPVILGINHGSQHPKQVGCNLLKYSKTFLHLLTLTIAASYEKCICIYLKASVAKKGARALGFLLIPLWVMPDLKNMPQATTVLLLNNCFFISLKILSSG